MRDFPLQRPGLLPARRLRNLLAVMGISMVFAAPVAQAANCPTLVATFNAAAEAGRDKEAETAIDKVANDPVCAGLRSQMQRRLAALRLTAVQNAMTQNKPVESFESALLAAEKPQLLWQASATLGEVRFNQRAFVEAAQAFDRAIEIVKSETLTPTAPQPEDIQRLLDRGSEARLLAANQQGGKGGKSQFVQTAANGAGALGGVYSPMVRGIVPRAIPIPITFEYRSAELTPVGVQAATELLRAIREQQPEKVRVVGHTDPRGGPDFNLKLSKARADAVAAFLRDNGVTVPIEAEGVGAAEPVTIDANVGLSPDDINALSRRVEWRRE